MPLRKWTPDEVTRFLEAIDGNLDGPFRLIIIGGSALAIGYSVDVATKDIDALDSAVIRIEAAAELARRETGLAIPLGPTGVWEMPYNFEDRLQRVLPHLTKLEVQVPEAHDLALSKLMRGNENDFLQIEELHRRRSLDMNVLIERHELETDHIASARARRELHRNLLETIERLWGEMALEPARSALKPPAR